LAQRCQLRPWLRWFDLFDSRCGSKDRQHQGELFVAIVNHTMVFLLSPATDDLYSIHAKQKSAPESSAVAAALKGADVSKPRSPKEQQYVPNFYENSLNSM